MTETGSVKPEKIIPRHVLTSYDLIKALAVILMLVDHIGYFFFPEQDWFRAIGRLCVPIWFFLIGFANSRDLSWRWVAGAGILIASTLVIGPTIIPVTILVTMLIIRMIIDRFARVMFKNDENFIYAMFLLLVLGLPTALVFEYGTQGMVISMFGYAVRHHAMLFPGLKRKRMIVVAMMLISAVEFVFYQQMLFKFPDDTFLFMAIGSVVIMAGLMDFKPMELPRVTQAVPGGVRAGVQFFGRRTLEIYVGHLILFRILGALTQPDRFPVWVMDILPF